MADSRLGERTSYAYPWKTLIDAGLHPAGGSDFPIESGNPFSGISAFAIEFRFSLIMLGIVNKLFIENKPSYLIHNGRMNQVEWIIGEENYIISLMQISRLLIRI